MPLKIKDYADWIEATQGQYCRMKYDMITKAQFGGIAELLTTIYTIPLSVNLGQLKHETPSFEFDV